MGVFMILTWGFPQSAHGISVGKEGVAIQGYSNPCYILDDVSLTSDGYVRLTFGWTGKYQCKPEVYSAQTTPAGKIKGTEGLKGSKAGKTFTILVDPDTTSILVDLPAYGGRFTQRRHHLEKFIAAAKRQKSGWQDSWKRSEKKLQDQRSADKTPPRINISSPSYPSGQKVVRLDSYQTYVRGKAADNEGILQILVNGRKAGLKADGSFASKVKLKLGVNKVRIQAEDINGNVGERILTVIREEFITEETLADVDMPPKTRMNNPNGVAVVIGVENYQYVSDATYAYNDAEVFREYLADTLGYKKSRIKIVTNSKATLAELNKLLGPNGWIAGNLMSASG